MAYHFYLSLPQATLNGVPIHQKQRYPNTRVPSHHQTRESPNALIPSQQQPQHQRKIEQRLVIKTPHQREIEQRLTTTTKPALRPPVTTFYTNNNTSRPQIKSSNINFQRCPGADNQRCPPTGADNQRCPPDDRTNANKPTELLPHHKTIPILTRLQHDNTMSPNGILRHSLSAKVY